MANFLLQVVQSLGEGTTAGWRSAPELWVAVCRCCQAWQRRPPTPAKPLVLCRPAAPRLKHLCIPLLSERDPTRRQVWR